MFIVCCYSVSDVACSLLRMVTINIAHIAFLNAKIYGLHDIFFSGSFLQGHPDIKKVPGVDMTTGSLGQGLSFANGMAINAKIDKLGYRVYCILGDGEIDEGQIWEAAMWAHQQKLDNLIAFTDYNKMQIDGTTAEICDLEPLDAKWRAFGWHVIVVADGNDLDQVDRAIAEAKEVKGAPTMIILNTIKGKGVSIAEAKGVGSHSFTVTKEEVEQACEEIRRA